MGMTLNFDDKDHPKIFGTKNFDFPHPAGLTVSAIMPAENLTVVVPTPDVHYNLTGTDAYTYYLSLPKNGHVDIHSSGRDHWVISSPKVVTSNETLMPNLDVSWRATPPVMTWPEGNTVNLYNLKTNLTVLNPVDKVNFYIIDPVAEHIVPFVNNTTPVDPKDPSERTVLETEYHHPGSTANKVARFHRYGTQGDWLDLQPPGHPNGTDLYLPAYYEGTIRQNSILRYGLTVEVFLKTGQADLNNLSKVIEVVRRTPDSTFVASQLSYHLKTHSAESGLAAYIITAADFIGSRDLDSATGDFARIGFIDQTVFQFNGVIALDKGDHNFKTSSNGCYQLQVGGETVSSASDCNNLKPSKDYYGRFQAGANALYAFRLIYSTYKTTITFLSSVTSAKIDLEVNLDGSHDAINWEVLYSPHSRESAHPTIPADTRPITGWPDFGYLLYSNSTKSFFYRQPITSADETDAQILKLPREYTGANFDPNSNLTASHLQPLVLTSNGHVQYVLNISPNHTEPITHHPRLTPLEMIWKTADFYKSSVQEINHEAYPHEDIIPAAVLPDVKNATRPCTLGFYDPHGSDGKGRVAVLDPGSHDEVQLHYAEVDSKAYNDGQLLNQTRCFEIDHQTNSSEATGYVPVHGVRAGSNDYYISFLKEQNQLFLTNTTSGNTDTLQTSELVPLDLLMGNDTVNVTHAFMNSNRDGVVATTAQGVILDISDSALRRSTEEDPPNPCILLHRALNTDYSIIGFIRGELLGWHLDTVALEQRITDELSRYPSNVIGQSPAVLPLQRIPPVFGEYNSDTYNMSRAYHEAGCPLYEHSWYIQPLKRIYGYPGNLTALGFDIQTSQFYGYDEELNVFTVKLPNFNASTNAGTEENCPKPKRFNTHQPEYDSLAYQNGVVYGTDEQGRSFMVGHFGQTLVGLDLINQTMMTTEKLDQVTQLTSYLEPFIPPYLEGVENQSNTTIASQLFLQLSSNYSGYQAWYRTDSNGSNVTTAEEGVYAFKGTGIISFLGSTLSAWYDHITENINWFFSSSAGELFKQEGDTQTRVGAFQ